MNELETKIRNYPNSFTKPAEIMRDHSYYTIDKYGVGEHIVESSTPIAFQYGGEGGIPLYYSAQNGRIYVDQTDKHSVIMGPTASKKSRLVAMPSVRILGAAKESMIISDPKAEIYKRTASYLMEKGYNVKTLDLREPARGSAWNPLSIPYTFFKNGDIDKAYEFANDIAVNLTNIEKSENDAFWDNSAGSFLFGLIVFLFRFCTQYNKPDEAVSIANVIKLRESLCSTKNANGKDILWELAKQDPYITSSLIGTVDTAPETRAGILSVFDQKMRAFSIQPALLSMLSKNDIDYASLREQPTALYLILPDEKTGYHGLVSLFVKQSYEYLIHLAQNNQNSDKTVRVNYILDEFSSLPTISDFSAMITAARSRNIRFNLFLQSKHQLRLRYGNDCDTILSNCENWIILNSREIEFSKEISDLCGECGGNQRKPLITIADLQRFDKEAGEALLLSGRLKPIITKLADIEFFDGGTPRIAEFSAPAIRDIFYIDFEEFTRAERNRRINEMMENVQNNNYIESNVDPLHINGAIDGSDDEEDEDFGNDSEEDEDFDNDSEEDEKLDIDKIQAEIDAFLNKYDERTGQDMRGIHGFIFKVKSFFSGKKRKNKRDE